MSIKLDGMTRKDLEKLQTKIENQLSKLVTDERKKARAAAEKAVNAMGFRLDEILDEAAAKRGRKKAGAKPAQAAAPKFAHPENPSVTWTGKGRQPKWYKEAIEAGKTPDDMAI